MKAEQRTPEEKAKKDLQERESAISKLLGALANTSHLRVWLNELYHETDTLDDDDEHDVLSQHLDGMRDILQKRLGEEVHYAVADGGHVVRLQRPS
jgi:hypothetical protein